ncbi:MAG TPA: hypothetical protein VLX92_13420 [Kofleriaceae bacterium]|nr:hypothetical protein [Kofleriaceae bacterium]
MRSSHLLVIAALAACSHADPPAPAPAPAAPAAVPGKTLQPAENLGSLASRLRYEAAHRPAAGPRAEAVLDAIDASGVRIEKRRQYLGMPMHAAYCAGGTARDGLAVSVCEYATPADAAAGRSYADRQFAAMSGAVRSVRGADVLTVVGPRPSADRALRTFATM